jgi:DNA-binding Lrp family transcriptional regulator
MGHRRPVCPQPGHAGEHEQAGHDTGGAQHDQPGVGLVDAEHAPAEQFTEDQQRGYRALVNPAAVGMGFEALVQITLERGDAGTVASFETALAELPQVRHAERLFGDPDYLLRVAARDLDSFATLRDQKLATLPGVHRLTSTIVMKRIIDNRPVPLATRDS